MILSALFTLCGIIPAFIQNPSFAIIMVSRVCVGIGFALATLRNAAIRKMFGNDPVKLATWLGFAQGFVNNRMPKHSKNAVLKFIFKFILVLIMITKNMHGLLNLIRLKIHLIG